jgi:putative ABC transport system permease protein
MGKVISNEQLRDFQFTIVGVYEDFPKNSSFSDVDMVASLDHMNQWSRENWVGNDRYLGYVKLSHGTDPSSLKDAIFKMQQAKQPIEELEKAGVKLSYKLVNLPKVHTQDPEIRSRAVILSIVAFLLILIATLNYLLVSVSEVVKRPRKSPCGNATELLTPTSTACCSNLQHFTRSVHGCRSRSRARFQRENRTAHGCGPS